MHGRPAFMLPVCMWQMAGSWLMASVCIERMKHMSSTHFAVYGSSSVFIQKPFAPTGLNLNFVGAIGNRVCPEVIVVRRCPLRIDSGRSLSYHSAILGL
jgi:hypothetical protein